MPIEALPLKQTVYDMEIYNALITTYSRDNKDYAAYNKCCNEDDHTK